MCVCVSMCVCYPPKFVKNRKCRKKKKTVRGKFDEVKLMKIHFRYWFIFNLRIGTEEASIRHILLECPSN